jgi:regulator of sirC expression with transglutaminase-like and TPR domain
MSHATRTSLTAARSYSQLRERRTIIGGMDEWDFAAEISRTPLDVARAALCFARAIAYPELDVARSLADLADLARAVRTAVPASAPISQKAVLLAEFLFQTRGFRGNVDDYGDPRNSYLNAVLERRLGIPISLSVLYVDVAGRLAIPAYGVGLPGHFIVGVSTEEGPWYFDPFHGGGRLAQSDCARLVQLTTGYSGPFRPAWLEPAPPRDVLARMLYNLRALYVQREDWLPAAAVIQHLRMLQPDVPEHVRDLGLLYVRQQALYHAVRYLELYLQMQPNAPDGPAIRSGVSELVTAWARMN